MQTGTNLPNNTTRVLRVDITGNTDFTQGGTLGSSTGTNFVINLDVGSLNHGSQEFSTFTVGNIIQSLPQAIGFIPNGANNPNANTQSIPGQLTNGENIMQTEAEFQRKSFQMAGAALRNSAGTIVLSDIEMARTYASGAANAASIAANVGLIRTVSPAIINAGSVFSGVITARVSSVADTTPVQGRN